jgi:hypothetical protein
VLVLSILVLIVLLLPSVPAAARCPCAIASLAAAAPLLLHASATVGLSSSYQSFQLTAGFPDGTN